MRPRGAARELGALVWAARVVVDPSSSQWPNLALLDAMWKGRPVIVNSGSASAKVMQEGGGICVRSTEEMGGWIRECLEDPEAARSAGAVSRRWVVHRHLAPRHLLEYLKLLLHLKGGSVGA
ncbi:MAG: glycosyltransferase [Acidobacteria bacterium]|nr:glycosyltransferase [Acidobacteriota bacterium]